MAIDCIHSLGVTIVLATNQAHLFGRPAVTDDEP